MKQIDICFLFLLLLGNNSSLFGQPEEKFRTYADRVNIQFSARFLLELEDPGLANFPFIGVDRSEIPETDDSTLLGRLKSKGYPPNYEIADTICNIRNFYLDQDLNDTSTFRKGLDSIDHYISFRVIRTKTRGNDIAGIEQFNEWKSHFQKETWEEYKTEVVGKFQVTESELDKSEGGSEVVYEPKFNLNEFLKKIPVYAGLLSLLIWIVYIVLKFRNTDRDWIPFNVKEYLKKELKVQGSTIKEQDKRFADKGEIHMRIQTLENDIKQLRNDVYALQSYHSASSGVDEKAREIELKVEPPKKVETYYLPFPDPGGFFWDDKKSGTQQSDTPYILEIDPANPNKGEFTLISNKPDLIRNAITSADTFLKPVCTIEGPVSGDRITVISKGQLERRNDKWLIADSKKLVIKIHN